jgi:hypothetical protein
LKDAAELLAPPAILGDFFIVSVDVISHFFLDVLSAGKSRPGAWHLANVPGLPIRTARLLEQIQPPGTAATVLVGACPIPPGLAAA